MQMQAVDLTPKLNTEQGLFSTPLITPFKLKKGVFSLKTLSLVQVKRSL